MTNEEAFKIGEEIGLRGWIGPDFASVEWLCREQKLATRYNTTTWKPKYEVESETFHTIIPKYPWWPGACGDIVSGCSSHVLDLRGVRTQAVILEHLGCHMKRILTVVDETSFEKGRESRVVSLSYRKCPVQEYDLGLRASMGELRGLFRDAVARLLHKVILDQKPRGET